MNCNEQVYCLGFSKHSPAPPDGLREYGWSDDQGIPAGDIPASGVLLTQSNAVGVRSLPYHSRSVIARSAGGKALNHQSQTPLNRGLTALVHPTEATLGDFVTSENAGTETDLYGWSKRMKRKRRLKTLWIGKSYSVQSLPDGAGEHQMKLYNMLCDKCGINEAYWSATWCEPCIWNFVKDDTGN